MGYLDIINMVCQMKSIPIVNLVTGKTVRAPATLIHEVYQDIK